MMMLKMRLTQGGNGGRYDEFGDCLARRLGLSFSWSFFYYLRIQLWYITLKF